MCVCVGVIAIFAILLCILSHQFIEVVHVVALLFFFFVSRNIVAHCQFYGRGTFAKSFDTGGVYLRVKKV